MAFMLLCTYIAAVAYGFALFIWFAAICAHIALIIWFTKRYFLDGFALKKVFASYFIVYVGIVVASVSAPVYGMQTLGNVAFWFGLICFILLFVLVSWRYVKIPEPTQPRVPSFASMQHRQVFAWRAMYAQGSQVPCKQPLSCSHLQV